MQDPQIIQMEGAGRKACRFEASIDDAKKILIIVPFYQNIHLIPDFVQAIAAVADEFASFDTKLVLINDSPADHDLQAALETYFSRLPKSCNATLIVNETREGCVKCYNRGLEIASAECRDAILLTSDTLLTHGAILEIAAVAHEDPLIGFVSPRTDNGIIRNALYVHSNRRGCFERELAVHRQRERFLPRLTYVPTASAFCLYIRHLMLAEFGLLDENLGESRYYSQIDFIMRCNQYGYRAVLANRAFVHHFGRALSDGYSDGRQKKTQKILLTRYPDYKQAVRRHFESVEYKTERLVSGFVPDDDGRLRILFDCSNFGCFHNGTFEFAKKLTTAFSQRFAKRYVCFIHCTQAALVFHGLDSVKELRHIGPSDQLEATDPFLAVIRLSQPFSMRDLTFWAQLAPIASFVMLDTIAMDCHNHNFTDLKLHWDFMLNVAPLIGYNSKFSRDQFRRRFHVPDDTIEFDAFHSVDPCDYLPREPLSLESHEDTILQPMIGNGGYVLIVGNDYRHKYVRETITLFQKYDDPPALVVLGLQVQNDGVVASYTSGELSDHMVETLYANASSVLFPSHYEGFGFPIMHALKYRKPIIARDLPCAEEIKAQTINPENIHLFATTEEMVRFSITRPSWVDDEDTQRLLRDWNGCAAALDMGLSNAIAQFQFSALTRRLLYVELLDAEAPRMGERQTRAALPKAIAVAALLPLPLERELAKLLCTIGQRSVGTALWNHANARRQLRLYARRKRLQDHRG